jgi:hypothetical protein
VFALLVCAQRIRRKIHTTAQCLVGLVTGGIGCVGWFQFGAHDNVERLWDASETETGKQVAFLGLVFVGAGLLSVVGRTISGSAPQSKKGEGL